MDSFLEVISPYKILLILILSSFMPVLAYAFLRTRVKHKQKENRRAIGLLGLDDRQGAVVSAAVTDEYPWDSYVVPVIAATLVTAFGMVSLFFAADLVGLRGPEHNVVLTGLFADADLKYLDQLRWQSMVVMTMAFLGAYLWSCQNIIRRFVAGDLAPIEYFNSTMRMILAPLLALMVAFLAQASGFGSTARETLPVVAFMAGMLPGAAFFYLQEKFARLLGLSENSAHDLRLTMIEGLNRFHEVRLSEAGIDNAQNLAEANLDALILKTPFSPHQLIDWIGQAQLFLDFKDDLEKLRRHGIRTAFDLRDVNETRLGAIATAAELSDVTLQTVAERLRADPRFERLAEFRRRLSAIDRPADQLPRNGATNGQREIAAPVVSGGDPVSELPPS
jgi:hypothetical protein